MHQLTPVQLSAIVLLAYISGARFSKDHKIYRMIIIRLS